MARSAPGTAETVAAAGDALLRTLLRSGRPVALMSSDGGLTWANQAALDLLGYERVEDLTGWPDGFVGARDVTRLAEAVGRLSDQGLDVADLIIGVHGWDGARADLRVELLPVRDDKGGLDYIVARLRHPLPRRAAGSRGGFNDDGAWQAFLDAPIAMSVLGPDAMPLGVNRALCELVGYSEEELLEAGMMDVNHPGDLPRLAEAMNEIVEGRSNGFSLEQRVIHKEGRVLWIQLSVTALRAADGKPLYFVCQEYDLTDRKEAEAAGQRQRHFDRTVSDMLTDMVAVPAEHMDEQLDAMVLRALSRSGASWICIGELDVATSETELALIWSAEQGRRPDLDGMSAKVSRKSEFCRRVTALEQFYIKDVAVMGVRYKEWKEVIAGYGIGSVMVLPLDRTGDRVPFVSFAFPTPSDLSFEDGALLRVAADLFATTLERASFELERERQSDFEQLLSQMAADFLDMRSADLDRGIEAALGRISEFTGAVSGFILLIEGANFSMTHEWCVEGVASSKPLLEGLVLADIEWGVHKLFGDEPLLVIEASALPEEAAVERRLLDSSRMNSVVVAPLRAGADVIGCVGFTSQESSPHRTDRDSALLTIASEIFASALGRKRADSHLARRVEFEKLIATLATHFISLPPERIDDGIEDALAAAATFVEAEGAFLVQLGPENGRLGETHGWTEPGRESMQWAFRDFSPDDIPWMYEQLSVGQDAVVISGLDEMEEEAATDRALFEALGIKSLVAVPVRRVGSATGVLGFSRLSSEHTWHPDVVRLLEICCEMIGNALDKQRAETALRGSEERFLQLTGNIKEFFWIAKPDFSDVVYASPAFEHIYGRPFEKMSPADFVEFIHPEDRAAVMDAILGARDLTRPTQALYRVVHEDGAVLWVSTRVFPIRDDEGKVYRMVGISEDVTRREETEAALRGQQVELARVLRLNTVGEMAAGLAHEINQPLSAIISFARGCERRLRSGNARMNDIFEALVAIAEQAERSSNVIRRLRGFLAREETRFGPTDLNALVRESVALVGSDGSAKRVRFSVDLDPALPRVAIDVVQIEQVLINLLRNGLDAAAASDGSKASVMVRSCTDESGVVRITVSDSGDGVSGVSFEELFEPFFTTKKEGLGMGLSISRSIVESHGGHIWAEPGEGGGLSVSFSLQPALKVIGGSDGV